MKIPHARLSALIPNLLKAYIHKKVKKHLDLRFMLLNAHVHHLFFCFQSSNGKFTQLLIKLSMFDLKINQQYANINFGSWLHLDPLHTLFISL